MTSEKLLKKQATDFFPSLMFNLNSDFISTINSYLPQRHKSHSSSCLSIFSGDECVSFTSSVSLDVGQSDMLAASKNRRYGLDAVP